MNNYNLPMNNGIRQGMTVSRMEQWTLSGQSLVSVLSEKLFAPDEFVEALGTPSFTSLVAGVEPRALSWLHALIKAKVYSHLPRLDMRFAKECGRSLFSRRCWEIRSYTFTYRSQTVDGREIEMSGRVTFLGNKEEGTPHQVKTISLHTHQALLDKEWAPSRSLMYMPLKVLWDSAVIEPDLQKWGVNYGIETDGGGSSVHMARQLADCTVAALELMRQHGVTLAPEGYTTNWGSSQGALPALQFAKWYDTGAPQWFKDTLRLRSTFAAEAAVDSMEMTRIEYQRPEYLSIEIIALVGYFQAFSPEQMGGYRPEDFVPAWYTEKKYRVDGRDISFLDAVNYSCSQVTDPVIKQISSFDQVVAPDMLTEDGKVDLNCPKILAWLSCVKKYNNLDDWTPQHPVYLAHCPKDDMMPYDMAYKLYRTVSNQGKNPNVHMLSFPLPGFIPTGGMMSHLVIAFLVQICMALEENPEDMRALCKSVK